MKAPYYLAIFLMATLAAPAAPTAKGGVSNGPMTPAQVKQHERDMKKAASERKKLLLKSAQKAKSIATKMAKVVPIPRPDVEVREEELEGLQQKAEGGDAAAMIRLGHYYLMHVEPGFANEAKGEEWFRKAAETGDADGIAWLALYEQLSKPKANKGMIQQRFLEAAEKGSVLGEYFMGLTTENYEDKLPWYEKAAERGFVPAMRELADAICEHNYRNVPSLRGGYQLTPEALAWAKLAAGYGDYRAYIILSKEGAYFSGSESDRPRVDAKKMEAHTQKAIELAKQLKYFWYGTSFDCRLMPGRYDWGGSRAYSMLGAYSDAYGFLMGRKKNAASFFRKFHADMTKMADEGDRDAMLVIVKAAKNWKFFFPMNDIPCPFKPAPYEQKLREMAKDDPLIPRLLAN